VNLLLKLLLTSHYSLTACTPLGLGLLGGTQVEFGLVGWLASLL